MWTLLNNVVLAGYGLQLWMYVFIKLKQTQSLTRKGEVDAL